MRFDGLRLEEELVPRAFIAREGKAGDGSVFYLHFLWMEDWTSNPLAFSKYLKGKLVYQKQPQTSQLFSRQCEMRDNTFFLADFEEPAFTSTLPPDSIKCLWALKFA